jgi:hypothetical protein
MHLYHDEFTFPSDVSMMPSFQPASGKRVGKEERTMSIENTQRTMEAYLEIW